MAVADKGVSMETEEILSSEEITSALDDWRWTCNAEEGRLMLAELLIKAGAGYYNSHTEEGFMRKFRMLKKDRTPNKRGRVFLCSMLYMHSNRRSEYYRLMEKYRQ